MGVRIQISARLIRWPQMCACCLGRADDEFETSHTRVSGKRVIRTDSRRWSVPYCTACLDHMDAEAQARSAGAGGGKAVLVAGVLLGSCISLFGSCCFGPAAFLPVNNGEGDAAAATATIVASVLLSVGAGVGVAAGSFFWSRRLDEAERQRHRRAMRRVESLASRDCCTLGVAVAYEGWYGSIHTFWFANSDYADAFIRANPGKVLRD